MIMSPQTSFDVQDAKALQTSLGEFYKTLWQEWAVVSSQWENLKQGWKDQQFDQFEPKFIKLSQTYDQVVQECEAYRGFLAQQVQIAESRKFKLGELVNDVITVAQLGASILGLGNVALASTSTQVDRAIHPLTSQVQEQTPLNSCLLDEQPNASSAAAQPYERLPGIARVMPLDEQLGEAYAQAREEEKKERQRQVNASLGVSNQGSQSGPPDPDL
jgi:hypothetical protein